MNNVNEKLNMGAAVGASFGAGLGTAFGAPVIGAVAGGLAGYKVHSAISKAFKGPKSVSTKPKAMSGPPKSLVSKPKTAPKKKVSGLSEGLVSFKDYVDEIDFGFTEEEFEVTGEEVYEDWNEVEELEEAEKGGRTVKLGKPFLTPGGPKKRAVYVKHPSTGNTVKVSFGDPNMRIKKSDPERRRSFRARHNCENPGPRHKARYWSCKAW